MGNNVYVVYGSTGNYDDYNEWPIKVFRDEAKAKEFVDKDINYHYKKVPFCGVIETDDINIECE